MTMTEKDLKKESKKHIQNIEKYKELLADMSNDFEDIIDDNVYKMSSLIQVQTVCIGAFDERSILDEQNVQFSYFFEYVHSILKKEALENRDKVISKYKGRF